MPPILLASVGPSTWEEQATYSTVHRRDIVFISTRTDEAALERRAAYEAAVSQGLVPLTYDASVHRLSTPKLPTEPRRDGAEARRTLRRPTWDHIATMIDQADYFVGVYDRTLGESDRAAAHMPWLRFELLRFLAAQLERRAVLARFGPSSVNDAMRHADAFARALTEELVRDEPTGPPGAALRDLLDQRAFLFQRLEPNEQPRSERQLAAMLEPFWRHLRGFNDHVLEEVQAFGNGAVAELMPVRAAHALLFRKLSAAFRELPRRELRQTTHPRLAFSLVAPEAASDRPGCLYVLLRTIFQQGLAVESLLAGAGVDRAPVRGSIVGLHAGGIDELDAVASAIDAALAKALPGWRIELSSEAGTASAGNASVAVMDLAEFRAAQAERYPDALTYRVQIANMPGVLWAVIAVATAFEANILHLSTNPEQHRGPTASSVGFEIGRTLDLELAVEAGPEVLWWNSSEFEYQLKSLHGYVAAEVVRGLR